MNTRLFVLVVRWISFDRLVRNLNAFRKRQSPAGFLIVKTQCIEIFDRYVFFPPESHSVKPIERNCETTLVARVN